MSTAAIYLAHLNPMTIAHESIISMLKRDYHVYVFPVRFVKDGLEVNTKSFPFPYELRKSMVESVFANANEVSVLPDYAFYAPYSKYLPPLLSSRSWDLRNQIIARVEEEKFVSYTGDKAERLMLRVYRLNPLKAERLEISASSIKQEIYRQAIEGGDDRGWSRSVPSPVSEIIRKHWDVINRFATAEDATIRRVGMKFPREGYR